jgi:hypothetical protein
VEKAIHGVVLAAIRLKNQAIPAEAKHLRGTDLNFESAGFNPVAGHLDHKAVCVGFVRRPFLLGLIEDLRR